MTELSSQQCSNLPTGEKALQHDDAISLQQQLTPLWQMDKSEQTIGFTYKFKNYYQTMAFVNIIAQIAHQQDHHPELNISYNRCTVSYSTHCVGGLSRNDFICAAKINAAQTL